MSWSAFGREEMLDRLNRDPNRQMALERRLMENPAVADVAKQLFASGRMPTALPVQKRQGPPGQPTSGLPVKRLASRRASAGVAYQGRSSPSPYDPYLVSAATRSPSKSPRPTSSPTSRWAANGPVRPANQAIGNDTSK